MNIESKQGEATFVPKTNIKFSFSSGQKLWCDGNKQTIKVQILDVLSEQPVHYTSVLCFRSNTVHKEPFPAFQRSIQIKRGKHCTLKLKCQVFPIKVTICHSLQPGRGKNGAPPRATIERSLLSSITCNE